MVERRRRRKEEREGNKKGRVQVDRGENGDGDIEKRYAGASGEPRGASATLLQICDRT